MELRSNEEVWQEMAADQDDSPDDDSHHYIGRLGQQQLEIGHGRERSLYEDPSSYFGTFTDYNHFVDYLEKAYRAQGNFEASWQYAPIIKTLHDSMMDDLPGDVVKAIANMRSIIRKNVPVEASWSGANYWYGNMTNYMEIILLIQEQLSNEILMTLDNEIESDMRNLGLVIFVLLLVFTIGPTIVVLMKKSTTNMQTFASTLVVQSKALQRERKRATSLLYRLLPKTIAQQIKKNEHVVPERFKEATVFFSDIVAFTSICSKSTPLQVIRMLNMLYSCFDARIEKYDVYKVETIGDAYMVVSGVPRRNGQRHAGEIATLALDLSHRISCLLLPHLPEVEMRLRIGIHSGAVVAGIVGTKMPRYCLFGNTVNIAERLETLGEREFNTTYR
ncbi:atrial natriuretic peptide receptor 2-like [Ptychodera flava]|uniref:atrial natriuretic peptide receptor 2-like n=1 Tax=Ptychodera flava TaxID=63121 RepID=UPI003969EB5E